MGTGSTDPQLGAGQQEGPDTTCMWGGGGIRGAKGRGSGLSATVSVLSPLKIRLHSSLQVDPRRREGMSVSFGFGPKNQTKMRVESSSPLLDPNLASATPTPSQPPLQSSGAVMGQDQSRELGLGWSVRGGVGWGCCCKAGGKASLAGCPAPKRSLV